MTNLATAKALEISARQPPTPPRKLSVRTLGELLEDPSILEPPIALIPNLLYPGRTTLISGREKSGKSTVVGQATSALSAGVLFFDQPLSAARVLWIGLDEPLGDIVRRANQYGAHVDNFLVLDERPETPAEWETVIRDHDVTAVIVDTLSDLWLGRVLHEKDANEVAGFLRPLARVVRDTNVALALLHHLPKGEDSTYRGSTAIGATVDIIATLKPVRRAFTPGDEPDDDDGEDDGRRVLSVKGRGGVRAHVALSFDGERYSVGEAPLPLSQRILRAIEDDECSQNEIAERVGKRRQVVFEEVRRLRSEGYVVQRGKVCALTDSGRYLLSAPTPPKQAGTSPEPPRMVVVRSAEPREPPAEPHGTTTEPHGNQCGTPAGADHVAAGSVPQSLTLFREPVEAAQSAPPAALESEDALFHGWEDEYERNEREGMTDGEP